MRGALTWARLSYRQQRWELILVALGVASVAVAMLYFATTLGGMRAASPECLANLDSLVDETGPPAACQAVLTAYYDAYNWGTNLVNVAWLAPFGIGVILGAPLVAREIDGGTAQLAWTLSRSRVGWLLRRIGFVMLVGLVLLAVVAITSDLLTAAMFPEKSVRKDFIYFGRRDLLLVARGAGAIMVGVLVGAVIGRVLPAVLTAALAIGLIFTGVSLGQDQWNRAEATSRPMHDATRFDLTGLDVAYGIQLTSGEFVSHSEAFQRGLSPDLSDENGGVYESEEDLEAGRTVGRDAALSIPGDRYPELVLRDSVIAVLVGFAALGLTAAAVSRRRPV